MGKVTSIEVVAKYTKYIGTLTPRYIPGNEI